MTQNECPRDRRVAAAAARAEFWSSIGVGDLVMWRAGGAYQKGTVVAAVGEAVLRVGPDISCVPGEHPGVVEMPRCNVSVNLTSGGSVFAGMRGRV